MEKEKQLINLLKKALITIGEERIEAVKTFQDMVWNDTICNEVIIDLLTEITYDLDYYEPNDKWRAQNASFYGDERLEDEIKGGLKKVDNLIENLNLELK